ncbi:MAG: hypothetical protein AAF447_08535 [Myxococcota bacterium]
MGSRAAAMSVAARLVAALVLGGSAAAQPPRQLPLRLGLDPGLDRCLGGSAGASLAAVRRIVSLELRGRLADEAETEVTRADADCGEGARIDLEVTDTLTGKVLRRSLDLGGEDPRARPRLLALGLVELVAASWTELRVTPSAPSAQRRAAAPAQRAVALEVARERDPERRALRAGVLRAGGGARWAADGLGQRGAGVVRAEAAFRLGGRWELALGFELERGRVAREVSLGEDRFPARIVLDAATLRTALAYRVQVGQRLWLGPSAALLYGAGRLDAAGREQGSTEDLGPVAGNLLGGALGLATGWRRRGMELGLNLAAGGWLLGGAITLAGEAGDLRPTLARYPSAFGMLTLTLGWHRSLEGDAP